jgi:hypothetical protein
MRRFAAPLLALLFPLLATAGPADIPSFQYFYAVPGADAVWGVACAPDGTIRAGGLGSGSVLTYSSDGEPLESWPAGTTPVFVAVADDGTVWVSPGSGSAGDDVRSFTPAGAPLVTIPATSGALAAALGGDVFVATNTRVERYRADGSPAGAWPYCYSNGCLYVRLRGIAVSADTTVYVSHEDGAVYFLDWFRPAGGQGALAWPWGTRAPRGVALDASSDELYVAFHDGSAGRDGVVKYSAARDTVGTAWLPPGAQVASGSITVDHRGHLHVPTSQGVARFGLGTDPVRRSSWGAVKRLGR